MANRHGCLALDPLKALWGRQGMAEIPLLEKRFKFHLKNEFDSRLMTTSNSHRVIEMSINQRNSEIHYFIACLILQQIEASDCRGLCMVIGYSRVSKLYYLIEI